MRRAVLALFLAAVVVVVVLLAESRESKKKREAAYEAAVQSYSQKFKPGMTRKEVETSLQKEGVRFMQMCCVEKGSYWDDLVRIGEEGHPWYCSEHYVYVAFEFVATQQHERWNAYETDVLKEIKRYDMLGGCL